MEVDTTYETAVLEWHTKTYYHTGRRCMVTAQVADLRFAVRPEPADPDAALNEAAPLFVPRNGGGRPSELKAHMIELLRERGPMSATHMAEVLEVKRGAVKNCLGNNLAIFERTGRMGGYVLYGLQED